MQTAGPVMRHQPDMGLRLPSSEGLMAALVSLAKGVPAPWPDKGLRLPGGVRAPGLLGVLCCARCACLWVSTGRRVEGAS